MMDIIRIAEHREQNHEPTSTVAASGNRRTVLILHSLAERLNPSTQSDDDILVRSQRLQTNPNHSPL